ncbi:MAG: DUF2922 domain-containing protein [Tissierellia bacterium]|nr:DUF2922 domain-containing protein [Tissierellia bacterium]
MIKTVLELKFKDAADGNFVIRIDDPKEDLDDEKISMAMRNILNQDIFSNKNLDITGTAGARKIRTTITEYEIA